MSELDFVKSQLTKHGKSSWLNIAKQCGTTYNTINNLMSGRNSTMATVSKLNEYLKANKAKK